MTNSIKLNIPHPSSFFPAAFIANHDIICSGTSLCSVGSSLPPSNTLCTPASFLVGWGEEQKDPKSVQALFSNSKNTLCVISTISSTNPKHSPSFCEELYPSQNQPVPCTEVHTQPTALWWCTKDVTGHDGAVSTLLVAHALIPFLCLTFGLSRFFFSYHSRALCHSVWSSHFNPTMSQEHWLLFRGFFTIWRGNGAQMLMAETPTSPWTPGKDFRECGTTKLGNSHVPKFEAMN